MLEHLIKKTKIDTSTKEVINKLSKDAEDFQKDWQTVLNTTISLNKLSDTEIKELFSLFEYPVSI